MAYTDVYNASQDAAFQGRCMAAVWDIAGAIVRDEPLTQSDTTSLNTPDTKNYALRILRRQQTVSLEQIAIQVLRNTTIAGNVAGATDNDIQWQIKEAWFDLMEIG